jgi:hypothetical protein
MAGFDPEKLRSQIKAAERVGQTLTGLGAVYVLLAFLENSGFIASHMAEDIAKIFEQGGDDPPGAGSGGGVSNVIPLFPKGTGEAFVPISLIGIGCTLMMDPQFLKRDSESHA